MLTKLCCLISLFKTQSIHLLLPSSCICLIFSYFRLFASNSRYLELFSIFLEGSSYRESTVLFIYETWSLPVIHAYSYFEKSCRKKCTPQSRKALLVVLSSLFFKEILKELVRKAVEMCLRVLKESNKSRFDRYSRQKQYWSYPILIPFGYRVQIFPTTVLEIAVYIHTYIQAYVLSI